MGSYEKHIARRKLRSTKQVQVTSEDRHADMLRWATLFVQHLHRQGLRAARVWVRPGSPSDVRVYLLGDDYLQAGADGSMTARTWMLRGGGQGASFELHRLPRWAAAKVSAARQAYTAELEASLDERSEQHAAKVAARMPPVLLAEHTVGSYELRVVYSPLDSPTAELWIRRVGEGAWRHVEREADEMIAAYWDDASPLPDDEQERQLAERWLQSKLPVRLRPIMLDDYYERAKQGNPADDELEDDLEYEDLEDDLEDSLDDEDEDADAARLRGNPAGHAYLPLAVVERWVPVARELGVSVVARSPRGFLAAYRRAGGSASNLSEYWRRRREGFVARHTAQAATHGEPLWQDGAPTRRHLALMMWAYSPTPRRL